MSGIIVGIDGSVHSRHALEWAVTEAALRGAPLTVLAVHQAVRGYQGGAVVYPEDRNLADQALKVARQETDEVLGRPGVSQPLSVTVRAISGIPAEELLAAAADMDADMIVVGSRGAGGFRKLLMGSVSSQVTHHAHCPVVVIPADKT
jgi:nucleotide-binding universal stress UspA family protein